MTKSAPHNTLKFIAIFNETHAMNSRVLCGADLVTLRSKSRPNETRGLHRVDQEQLAISGSVICTDARWNPVACGTNQGNWKRQFDTTQRASAPRPPFLPPFSRYIVPDRLPSKCHVTTISGRGHLWRHKWIALSGPLTTTSPQSRSESPFSGP